MKFPLMLSCGHDTVQKCSCSLGAKSYKSNGDSPIDKALEMFNGRWRDTLESYGCQLPRSKNHGPCPVCGGKDRFRFDDKQGRGTWFCSQCEPQSGGGLKLLSMFINKSTMDTAKELLGDDDYKTIAPKRIQTIDHDAVRQANIEQAKKGAKTLIDTAKLAQHGYMLKKGLTSEYITNGQPIFSKGGVIEKGSLLLIPVYKNNELVNVQKITIDGDKKPLFGGDMQGVQHVIEGSGSSVAIVEGFATGVTVNNLTGYKTYVAFNTGNLLEAVKKAKADNPDSRIVIFADHDSIDENHNRRPGEYYANEAAAPFGALVALPPELGDWDDYRQKHGEDECKNAMREAIKADIARVQPQPEPVQEQQEIDQPMPAFGSWIGQSNNEPKKEKEKDSELPEGICLDDVDIDNPPGLAGDIVKYMKSRAHRELEGGAYSAMAVQCLAMAGSSVKAFRGGKLSLVTFTLGMSAAGKEMPQEVVKEILQHSNINIYGDIRSDKDVLRAAVYDDGRCFYVSDEAHKWIGGAIKGADKNTASIPALLMNIATTSSLQLSRLHQEGFRTDITTQKSRAEKTLLAKQDIKLGFNVDLEKEKIAKIDFEIEKLQQKVDECEKMAKSLESGIKNPALNLAAFSTPQKLASIIDEDGIESGFLGRSLIFDCGVERVQKKSVSSFEAWNMKKEEAHEDKMLLERIKAEVAMIAQMSDDIRKNEDSTDFYGNECKVIASDEANYMLFTIDQHYEQHRFLNHDRLGALYARIAERVMSVSSMLALYNVKGGNMVIEVEHVKYALLIVLNSVEHLASNLRINEAKEEKTTVEAKLEGIKEAIIKRLKVNKDDKQDGWRYKTYLRDYLKRQNYYKAIAAELQKHNQDAFENSIIALQREGKIIVDDKKVKLR